MRNLFLKYLFAMRWPVTVSALCLSIALFASCSSDDDGNSIKTKPIPCSDTRSQEIVAQTNGTSWNLLRESISDADNTLLSPFSLAACMAMLDNGAAGNTEQQIRELLGYGSFSKEEFNALFKTVLSGLPNVDASVKLSIANSLWHKKGLQPQKQFKKVLADAYDAKTFSVDFANSKTLNEINGWCSKNTKGLIPKFLTDLSSETVALLLNALYFKAEWTDKFPEQLTKADDFNCADGSRARADYMHRNSSETGFVSDEITMVCLPMGKGRMIETFFILPAEGIALTAAATAAQLAFGQRPDFFDDLFAESGWSKYRADMSIPKFTLATNGSLRQTLERMGQASLFGGDYSSMFESANAPLSDICQACYFTINEREVEAAAVTGTGLESMPNQFLAPVKIELNLNRPFLFGLRETSSNAILFLGAIQRF